MSKLTNLRADENTPLQQPAAGGGGSDTHGLFAKATTGKLLLTMVALLAVSAAHAIYTLRGTLPLRVRDLALNTSIVAACSMTPERLPAFLKSSRSWTDVEGVSEVVLVDWGSEMDLEKALEVSHGPQYRIFSVTLKDESKPDWDLSEAYNFAFSLVKGGKEQKVMKVDCDTYLHPRALVENPLGAETGYLRRADYKAARDRNDAHLNGVFYGRLADINEVGGYDERIKGWGYDDEQLYHQMAALLRSKVPQSEHSAVQNFTRVDGEGESMVEHVEHPRSKTPMDGERSHSFLNCQHEMLEAVIPQDFRGGYLPLYMKGSEGCGPSECKANIGDKFGDWRHIVSASARVDHWVVHRLAAVPRDPSLTELAPKKELEAANAECAQNDTHEN